MELRQALETNDVAEIRAKTQALEQAAQPLAQALYAQASQQASSQAGEGGGPTETDEVVEGLLPLPLRVLEPRKQLLDVELELADLRREGLRLCVGLGGRHHAALLEARVVATLVRHVVFAASSSSMTS